MVEYAYLDGLVGRRRAGVARRVRGRRGRRQQQPLVGQREAGRGLRVRLHGGRRGEHLGELLCAHAAARLLA